MITTSMNSLVAADIPFLLEIENDSFDYPWNERDFIRAIANGFSFCLKHAKTRQIVGYIFYIKDDEGGIEITNLAVHKDYRKLGLGRKMLEHINKAKIYKEVYGSVSERSLDAQLFLKALGFKAITIIQKMYDNGDDAYFFNNTGGEFEYSYNIDRKKNYVAKAA